MKFGFHRQDHEDEDYDSLWDESEQEDGLELEQLSESESEGFTPPPPGVYQEESEEEHDASINERSFKRRSLLSEEMMSPQHVRQRRDRDRINVTSPQASKRRSIGPHSRLFTQEQLNSELGQLTEMVDQWSANFASKCAELNDQDQEQISRKHSQYENLRRDELDSMTQTVQSVTERRRSNIQMMLDQRKRLQELIEQEKREEEDRIRREEEERQRKEQERIAAEQKRIEEEKRRKQEEEQKKQQEEEQKRREAEEAAEQKRREDLERKEAEEQERQRLEAEKQQQKAKADSQSTSSSNVEREFFAYKQEIDRIKAEIKEPVAADKQLKNGCFQVKRKIKPKLGQLTTSMSKVKTIINEMTEIFNEAKGVNELVYLWSLNFFAKAVLQQAETEATVSTHAAMPLGILATQMMQQFPELIDLQVARFVKRCPHVIGFSCGIDTEEGRKRMGWKKRNDKWEDETQYCERVGGMTSVWAVITQLRFSAQSGKKHPYPISHAWTYLSRQVNKPNNGLLTNDAFSSVAAWWDVSAQRFVDAFGKQGVKLLTLAWDDWTNSVADKKYPAAARLRLLGEDWISNGALGKKIDMGA